MPVRHLVLIAALAIIGGGLVAPTAVAEEVAEEGEPSGSGTTSTTTTTGPPGRPCRPYCE